MNDFPLITACGLLTPFGVGLEALWAALVSGQCAIAPIDSTGHNVTHCKSAAPVKGLDKEKLAVAAKDARIMNTHSYMLMQSCLDAFNGGGLGAFSAHEVAFYAGLGMVDYEVADLLPSVAKSIGKDGALDIDTFYTKGYQCIHPLWPLSMLNNIAFSQVAVRLGVKGDSAVFSAHADSGAQAIIEGVSAVQSGICTAAIAGGVSEKVNPLSMARGQLLGVLSGSSTSAPFSALRDGTVLGEGAAMFAIEKSSTALSRGLKPLARITGWGLSFGQDENFCGPNEPAITASMEKALSMASLTPADVDVIIANGDGTVTSDAAEAVAIDAVFARASGRVRVYSSRGAVGHLLAGAPAVDLAIAAMILKHKMVPPTITVLPVDSNVRFNLVMGSPVKVDAERILINALSYEGQSVSFIVEGV